MSKSLDVDYSFGQMGSAHGKVATPIYPPKGMAIIAIQFLADNTPTVLQPEQFGKKAGFHQYHNTESGFNFGGIVERNVTNGSYSAKASVTISTASPFIKAGQYVLLINQSDSNTTGITVDSETPTPGLNTVGAEQGCKVVSYGGGTTDLVLDCDITPSSQSLVFIDESHGAGGQDASSITYPKGLTIYGRWTKVTPSADTDGGIICYFGY